MVGVSTACKEVSREQARSMEVAVILASGKMQILKRHLVERVPVSALCDELGIGPHLFYPWQRELFEGGEAVFANDRQSKAADDAKNRVIERLQAKLLRKNEVLAELMDA